MNKPVEQEFVMVNRAEYLALLSAYKFLGCLQDTGVDSWEGYDMAVKMSEEASV